MGETDRAETDWQISKLYVAAAIAFLRVPRDGPTRRSIPALERVADAIREIVQIKSVSGYPAEEVESAKRSLQSALAMIDMARREFQDGSH